MSRTRSTRRAGATLVETLVSLLLTLLLVMLMALLAVRQRTAGETLARRMEVVEARRVARDLVEEAVDGGGARSTQGSRMGVRSFVGWAASCPGDAWRYRGRRRPDPDRDSVWLVSSGGETWVSPLSSVSRGECGELAPGEEGLGLGVVHGPGAPVLARVFEGGRYQLSDAFRYGREGDPAQPLTGAVLEPGSSGLTVSAEGVTMTMRGAHDSASVSRRWWVR